MAFLQGLGVGLAMVIFIGPVLFTLLRAALHGGVRLGMAVAFGIIVSDIVAVVLCYFGFGHLLEQPRAQSILAFVGAAILLGMALRYWFQKPGVSFHQSPQFKDVMGGFAKGFAVNFINPFVFAVWIGVCAMVKERYTNDLDHFSFLFAALLGIFITDSLKALFANNLRKLLNERFLATAYKTIAVVLALFGLRLVYFIAAPLFFH